MLKLLKKYLKRIYGYFVSPNYLISPNPDSSEFEVNNWAVSRFVLRKIAPIVGFHPYPLNEIMLMSSTVCRFRPSYIFEWGTNIGASARIFYETGKYFSVPLSIYSIDLPIDISHAEHPGESRGDLVRGKKNVELHLGDGLTKSLEIYDGLPKAGRPLFFIDGDHSYDSVKRELIGVLSHVTSPLILLHDTFYQSPDSGYNLSLIHI